MDSIQKRRGGIVSLSPAQIPRSSDKSGRESISSDSNSTNRNGCCIYEMPAMQPEFKAFVALQRSDAPLYRLEAIDFGRRMAVEKELEKNESAPQPNVVFDESSNFLIYATLLGIKIINLHTNTVARILGKVESNERYLRVALYQGDLGGKKVRKFQQPQQM